MQRIACLPWRMRISAPALGMIRRSWRGSAQRHLAELENLSCKRASERDRRCFSHTSRLLRERIAMVNEHGEMLLPKSVVNVA